MGQYAGECADFRQSSQMAAFRFGLFGALG
jgi:hypothetical protein